MSTVVYTMFKRRASVSLDWVDPMSSQSHRIGVVTLAIMLALTGGILVAGADSSSSPLSTQDQDLPNGTTTTATIPEDLPNGTTTTTDGGTTTTATIPEDLPNGTTTTTEDGDDGKAKQPSDCGADGKAKQDGGAGDGGADGKAKQDGDGVDGRNGKAKMN